MTSSQETVHVIGGGLAGSEAAWQLARAGVRVVLHEMRPDRTTSAHKTDRYAELVCSNSFRSDDAETNAVGLLHAEMRLAGSLVMACGDAHQVPAGGALAVDRERFSAAVTARLDAHPLIDVRREEVTGLLHPAFASCPGHDIWKRDWTGSASIFSIILGRWTREQVVRFVDALELFKIGYSWGGANSLVMTYANLQRPTREMGPLLVRLNIGLEDPQDLIEDLEQALAKAA